MEPIAFVLSTDCTHDLQALDLVLPAGVPVQVPESLLPQLLALPGVVQTHPADPEPEAHQEA